MADFMRCFKKMLEFEGGYSPKDFHGQSYAGISRRDNPDWPGWELIHTVGAPWPELVMDFYYETFWKPLNLENVANDSIAFPIFDFAVTSGIKQASSTVQRILFLDPSGGINTKTINALNSIEPWHFRTTYAIERIWHYTKMALSGESQRHKLPDLIMRTIDQIHSAHGGDAA